MYLPRGETPEQWVERRLARHRDDHVMFNVALIGDRWLQVSEQRTDRRRHGDPADRRHRHHPAGAEGTRADARRSGPDDPRDARPYRPGRRDLRRRPAACRLEPAAERASGAAGEPAGAGDALRTAGRACRGPKCRCRSGAAQRACRLAGERGAARALRFEVRARSRDPARCLRAGDAGPRLRDELHRRDRRADAIRASRANESLERGSRNAHWSSRMRWHEAERANAVAVPFRRGGEP